MLTVAVVCLGAMAIASGSSFNTGRPLSESRWVSQQRQHLFTHVRDDDFPLADQELPIEVLDLESISKLNDTRDGSFPSEANHSRFRRDASGMPEVYVVSFGANAHSYSYVLTKSCWESSSPLYNRACKASASLWHEILLMSLMVKAVGANASCKHQLCPNVIKPYYNMMYNLRCNNCHPSTVKSALW